ncbi:hypothetical protein J2R76_003864 [Bradyrhizobium sp. USDA 4532]|nr:hypothetical protein [Bradyrhizobium sp. USDA 4545]MCP1920273.1 hypothetical protein [Bradyrhizobium sp. USDA 4532]
MCVLKRHIEGRETARGKQCRCCVKDECRSLGIGLQEQVSNRSKLLQQRAAVASVRAVRAKIRGQARQEPPYSATIRMRARLTLIAAAHRPEATHFLGLTLYCTRNRKDYLKSGMRRIRHPIIGERDGEINAGLRSHYAYHGVAGNLRSLVKIYRIVDPYWRKMLCNRSWAGCRITWDAFPPTQRADTVAETKTAPRIRKLQVTAVLSVV